MPEVCEIFLTVQYLLKRLANYEITKINIEPKYKKLANSDLKILEDSFPLKLSNISSKGKLLWFELYSEKKKKTYYILNTFGLFGEWGFEKLKHSKVSFVTNNPKYTEAFYSDTLSFGSFKILDNQTLLIEKINSLAPDFLQTEYTSDDIEHRLSKIVTKKGDKTLYEILLEQQIKKGSIGSGIGNYLVAEICYNAKISPFTKITDLFNDKEKIKKLVTSIKYMIKMSLLKADDGYFESMDKDKIGFITKLRNDILSDENHILNFHNSIIIKKSDKFQFHVYQQQKDTLNNIVSIKKVGDRKVYWVENLQH